MAHQNGVWIPGETLRKQEHARARQMAELNGLAQLTGICREWTPVLKEIDPYLEMVWVPENARAAGLTPGRFTVLRHNPGAPPSIIPVEGPDGEFVIPNSGLLDVLRKADLWSSQAVKERKRKERELEDAKKRQEDREREERIEEFTDRWKALEPSVSMTGQGKGWSYKAGAKRAA